MASLNPIDEHSRIAATWDTVALFLPLYYQQTNFKVESYVHRRMNCIVKACRDRLLDVGCGDGAILRYLSPTEYCGLDISTQMISLAKTLYPRHNFQVGSFPQDVPSSSGFDCILFNGSLQFFADTRATLTSARDLLLRCDTPGRIVISHVHGASFVRNECRSKIACQELPTMNTLLDIAHDLGLQLLTKIDLLGESLNPNDADDKNFYLVALEKQV
jgi:SAM-dependent methyltransferase